MQQVQPDDLARGEFGVSGPSFALAKQVLDYVIDNCNGWIGFDVRTSDGSSSVGMGGSGYASLRYHGTRQRETQHFYGLEDTAGIEIGLMVIDEDEITEVTAGAVADWLLWHVRITFAGGTQFTFSWAHDVG